MAALSGVPGIRSRGVPLQSRIKLTANRVTLPNGGLYAGRLGVAFSMPIVASAMSLLPCVHNPPFGKKLQQQTCDMFAGYLFQFGGWVGRHPSWAGGLKLL